MRCEALKLTFSKFVFAAACIGAAAAFGELGASNIHGWNLLLNNKPCEAEAVFLTNSLNSDRDVAGEAFRGLAEVAAYLGNDEEECRYFFKGYQKDKNALAIVCDLEKVAKFREAAWAYKIKEGYAALEELSRKPGLFAGQFQDELTLRYLNDGKIGKASSLVKRMGVIHDWRYIGPFDNISHSGFNRPFPPEQEIDFSKTYEGKDGNRVKWSLLVSSPSTTWTFVEDHVAAKNAVNYFYCTVQSPVDQEAYLSFGASGMFKIFLNGEVALADSVFRNTACDLFMQRVKLYKGDNSVLVKLGHEWGVHLGERSRLSNFTLRFLDGSYRPLTSVSISPSPASRRATASKFVNVKPQPIVDSAVSVLKNRLGHHPEDIEASLLLAKFYNSSEMTDESQKLLRQLLKSYPTSAFLHMQLYESLYRSKKFTEAAMEAKSAFTAAPNNYLAWATELVTMGRSDDDQRLLDFIDHSAPNCATSAIAVAEKIKAFAALENRNAAMACLADLEKKFPDDAHAVALVASACAAQGDLAKANKVMTRFLKHSRMNGTMYMTLASMELTAGKVKEAAAALNEGLDYRPVDADAHITLARFALYAKEYARAKKEIDKALEIMPGGSVALNLKGSILQAMGDRADAERTYKDAIAFTNDDFNAWDNLRQLNNKPSLDSMAPLPSIDSIVTNSRTWKKRSAENGAILFYDVDVFYYPSKCSKERRFLVIELGTQHAIDLWKEYTCGYNGNFQNCTIARALTIKQDGRAAPADVDGNQVVFKSLQPGDCIALEWTLKNYYFGEMAKHVWGEQDFQLSCPTFAQRFRLIAPVNDSVPYNVYGDSLAVKATTAGDYRIVTVARPAYDDLADERFTASDWPGNPKVTYSTFGSWSQIVDWYRTLTAHVKDNTMELQALADSLLDGATTPRERVKRIHRYITNAIRYSYVSFRQSGWIPQPAHDVMATRIGDCKDMASLGMLLFEKAGIPANLVLVNTETRNYLGHTCIGPAFNHCILSYTLDGATRFIDFTNPDGSINMLPWADQGAVALIIAPGSTAPVLLPLDSADKRTISRTITSTLDEKGDLAESVATIRTGILAGGYRSSYRTESQEKRLASLQEILVGDYPNLTVDSFAIQEVDSLCDSLKNTYRFHAKNTVAFSGATAVFRFHIPDALDATDFPNTEKRRTPIDGAELPHGIATQRMSAALTLPSGWKPINLPESVSYSSNWGSYQLAFELKGRTIACRRTATFTVNRIVDPGEYGSLREFLCKIEKADAVQLVFQVK
jgi:tetratricopeptide (TPR) repeat protein/transglutaminase-like putative cysteine protease